MSVSGGKVITNIGYLVMTACVTLSVLVSCEIRTTCMLWVFKSARTSSSATLDGTPFSTSRGCMASGSGYLVMTACVTLPILVS